MNRGDMDGDLRERFARLREDERARAGSFLRVRTRFSQSRQHRSAPSIRVIMTAAAVVAIAVVTVTLGDRRGIASVDPAFMTTRIVLPVGSWDAPTDFLLKTPGAQLLNTLPSIGRASGWGLTGSDAEGARPIRSDSQGRNSS